MKDTLCYHNITTIQTDHTAIRGLQKLKKIPKIQTWIELTPPTHPSSQLFWKPITDMERTLKS